VYTTIFCDEEAIRDLDRRRESVETEKERKR